MMRYLYVDNFRGFKTTFIPIKDVNFLVGENSTGKTSILRLLKLLSSPQFWFHQDFNTDEVHFSHFKDIVSVNSSNKKYFDIGMIDIGNNQIKDSDNKVNAFIMTFSEHDGMPFLKRYTYNSDDDEIRIIFTQKTIKYKINTINEFCCDDKFITKTYKSWIYDHRTDKKNYISFPGKFSTSIGAAPLLIISSIISDIHSEKKDKKDKKDKKFQVVDGFPVFNSEMAWLAPVRSKPKRTYDSYKADFSPEGDHTPYLIKRVLGKESSAKDFKNFAENVGKESGLFEGISVKQYERGATSPFELDVIINSKPLNVCSVGYGVSQSLPVLVELFVRSKNSWFAIQQPEVHLHPKAQAAFGSVFYSLASFEGKKFFIETHSDYIIDRFRINYRKIDNGKKPESQILYFERNNYGNKIFQIEIGSDGELPADQPSGYREFFVKEEMQLLGL